MLPCLALVLLRLAPEALPLSRSTAPEEWTAAATTATADELLRTLLAADLRDACVGALGEESRDPVEESARLEGRAAKK